MTKWTAVAAAPTAAWRNRIATTGGDVPRQLRANRADWWIHPVAQQDGAVVGVIDTARWARFGAISTAPPRRPRGFGRHEVRPDARNESDIECGPSPVDLLFVRPGVMNAALGLAR